MCFCTCHTVTGTAFAWLLEFCLHWFLGRGLLFERIPVCKMQTLCEECLCLLVNTYLSALKFNTNLISVMMLAQLSENVSIKDLPVHHGVYKLSMKHGNDNWFSLFRKHPEKFQKNHIQRQLINQVVRSISKECLLL